ncbi:MAG: hypothetical protein K2J04_04995 [Lachnospiraceae bacterium]|nr:hypothetical protein [Lachnospiraceae bacterium]
MKVLKSIFYTFLTAVLLLFFYFFFGGAICNDIKASRIEKEYAVMELPEKTRRVSTVSYVGNTSGAGNLTEIWAGMVVYSELSAEELEEFFDGYYVVELPVGLETTEWQELNDFSKELYPITHMLREKLLSALKEPISSEGYFIINKYYDAFTQQDLRGH